MEVRVTYRASNLSRVLIDGDIKDLTTVKEDQFTATDVPHAITQWGILHSGINTVPPSQIIKVEVVG